jgi:hypothetical protein
VISTPTALMPPAQQRSEERGQPWVACGVGSNRNAVVAKPLRERGVAVSDRIEEATTALRLIVDGTVTQGSLASSATLGLVPESRWDSLHEPDPAVGHGLSGFESNV